MANPNSTPRVALYARVSTKNNGQDPETQLIALREYAQARRLEVFSEYVDVGISGSKDKPLQDPGRSSHPKPIRITSKVSSRAMQLPSMLNL